MKSRPVRWAIGSVTALLCAAGLVGACSWSPGAAVYLGGGGLRQIELRHRLRNGPEHDRALRRVGNPYVLEIKTDQGALLYYGARHSRDANDPQIADIERRWDEFQPTVALCEGRSRGYMIGSVFEAFAGLTEPALVHKLARRDDVTLYSLEPNYETEVAELMREWSAEQVALYFTMRVYWGESGGEANDGLAAHLLRKRTNVKGLEDSLNSVADIDRVWRRDFGGDGSAWRTLRSEPVGTYLSEISPASQRIRGEHMARVLIDLVRRGERVFSVVGGGHVIRQEWALRAALNAPPALDQPE